MSIDLSLVSKVREMTGAGIVDVKKALEEAGGDEAKAIEALRKKGIAKAAKKAAERTTKEGLVECYSHAGGKVGVIIEILCETDFVARNEEFKALAHELALQVAATDPLYISAEAIPPEMVEKEKMIAKEEFAGSGKPADVIEKIIDGKIKKWQSEVCLLAQNYIKDEDKTVADLVTAVSAKMGEKIEIRRFCRYAVNA